MANTTEDIFKEFYPQLLKILPVDCLINHFFSKKLLSSAHKSKLQDISTNKERAKYFLDEVIEPGVNISYIDQFDEMLLVMEKSDDPPVKYLANKIMKSRVPPTPMLYDQTPSQAIFLNTESQSNHSNETLDFTEFEDVSLAFSALFSRIQKEVKLKSDKDFDCIKIACVARANHKLSEQILRTGDINDLFQVFAENKPHCNWLHVRFLEVIATASENRELVNLIRNYKKIIFSKKLREVWSCLPYHRVRTEYYAKLQVKFDGKDPDSVTIDQLKKMCEPYLIKEIALNFTIIEEDSLRITWLIPTNVVYKAYLSALMIPKELRLDNLLQIGEWVVYHPLHVLQDLQKVYWWILPSTLLIGYYHGLLMRNIDVNLVIDKMCLNNLLAPSDQEMMFTAHSIHQRNWVTLEYVRSNGIQVLVKFCEFMQEILPEVGLQLLTALDSDAVRVTELHSFTPDKRLLVFKNTPTAYSLSSSLHVLFLDVIDQVKELLQWYDTGLLAESFKTLMASETHKINLFSDSYVANLSNYTSAASVLQYLSFLFTWSDHSILRTLVSCSPEAIQLLDEFDCFLDPFNTIVSYPIDVFSLSMIPFEDSPFTLLAIRSYMELWQCSLQYVFNVRSILVELGEITQHCLQLIAVQSDPTIFFWNIPKCVVELIHANLLKHVEDLCSQGIVEVTVYPKQLIFTYDDIVVGSFSFVTKQEELCKSHKSLLDQKVVQQQSEIEILSAKLEVLNKERKQLIGNQNIVKQELVSKLETLNKENKQLIEDQNIRQQELDSKLEARSKENRKLIEQSKLSDQKVSEQNSEIKMLNLELEALREKHKQLTDIHCKVKSECASLRKGVGQESEIKSEEQESEIKIEERESEIKGEEQESGIKSEEQESEKLKSEITPEIFTVDTAPLLKDLYQHITPQHAADWKTIETLLGIPIEELEAIEAGYPTNVKWCCNQMWILWLKVDTTASWRKLFTIIESPAVSCSAPDKVTLLTSKLDHFTITGAEAVSILANRVSKINIRTRFMVDDKAWPPVKQPSFTPLLFIHHHDDHSQEEIRAKAELMYTGNIGKVTMATEKHFDKLDCDEKFHKFHKMLETSKATKEIEEILAPLEKSKDPAFILIEGAPGIGKSVLLKEISYRWANKELLQKFELVLLVYLRDPSLQEIVSVNDLLQLFGIEDNNATQIASTCAQYLFANSGKTLTLLLDGYDEYPAHLWESSLIYKILKRQVLPLCGLVVSSRPHASEHLREQATIRLDILGFTETEREQYIKQALPDQPDKIEELTEYLHQQPSIDNICFIPFNMVILLYLYKLGNPLPSNSTELYYYFICSTITRHLFKFGNPLTSNKITNLADLPEPCNRIIKQLSKLSLEALNNNKRIFTLDEITAACPDIAATPGAINGFGLLQAIQHFGLYGKTMTFNFIHSAVQEYLAALYISDLPPNKELKVIEANFWSDIHFNMFSIYISLTKGQRSSFKKFLSGGFFRKLFSGGRAISRKILNDQLKCLRLYHCFKEANNETLCKTIERAEVFNGKVIDLRDTTLTGSDIECVSLVLASSFNKEWEGLNLRDCYIQDKGLNTLWRGLRHTTDISINKLELYNNGLTVQSSSLISELTVRWKVKVLGIVGNKTIGEDQQLYTMLSNPSSVLERLYMWDTQLSSTAATDLFTSLRNNHKLKELYIEWNDITDDACDAIIAAMKSNSCLTTLIMYRNPLSSEAIVNIVQCLEVNDTLQLIELPNCPQATQENIRSLQEVVNNKRASRGCRVKLEIRF